MNHTRTSIFHFTSISLLTVLTISAAHGGSLARRDFDHLTPVAETIPEGTLRNLHSHLCITGADYGRFLLISSGPNDGGRCIALYSNNKSPTGVTLTCTAAENKINDAIPDAERSGDDRRKAKVTRLDVPISKAAAEAVLAASRQMLSATRPFNVEWRPEDVVLHGTTIEISVERDGTAGALAPAARGARSTALRKMIHSLVQYFHVDPSRRPAEAQKVESDAKRLGSILNPG